MAKYGARPKTSSVRLLAAGLFFFISGFVFSQEVKFAEVKYGEAPLFLNSYFFVEVKLNDGFPDYYKFLKSPELKIEEDALYFESSTVSSAYGGLIIKNKYTLKKIGRFKLEPKIVSKKNKMKLDTFYVKVEPPPLSAHTVFRWKIFSDISDIDTDKTADTVMQGIFYTIVLEGFFYSDSDKDAPVLNINCSPPENTLLKEITADDFTLKPVSAAGWKKAAFFSWVPLKAGHQQLPEPVITVKKPGANVTRISMNRETIFVNANTKQFDGSDKITAEEKDAQKSLRQAMEIKKESPELHTADIKNNFETKKWIALEIAELRQKENRSFFSNAARLERIKHEKELDFDNTFPVYSSYLKKITFAVFLFLVLLIAVIRVKKKRYSILSIGAALCFFGLSVYLFAEGKNARAVFVPDSEQGEAVLYHIPEVSGTAAGELLIGETVLIVRDIGEWVYVRKNDGMGGWFQKKYLVIIGE